MTQGEMIRFEKNHPRVRLGLGVRNFGPVIKEQGEFSSTYKSYAVVDRHVVTMKH